jgi:hypothetical protein
VVSIAVEDAKILLQKPTVVALRQHSET